MNNRINGTLTQLAIALLPSGLTPVIIITNIFVAFLDYFVAQYFQLPGQLCLYLDSLSKNHYFPLNSLIRINLGFTNMLRK